MSATPLVSARFPYLPLTLRVRRYTTTVLALLDTDFDGDVVLPLDLLPPGLAPDAYFRWMLADGTRIQAPTYDGTVDGTVELGRFGPFEVVISVLGDEPLVGRGVTDRFAVTLDHGRRVIVAP